MSLVPLRAQHDGARPRLVHVKKSLSLRTLQVDSFLVADTIGDGVSGKVKRAALRGAPVALKVIKKETIGLDAVQREVSLQAKCHDHDNVTTCFDFMENKEKFFVAMELAQCDLFDFVRKAPGALEIDTVKEITFQLLSAVAHMHSKGVCHRDIKPENILMLSNTRVGLVDFGFAMEWSEEDGLLSSAAGTVRCLPPEMFFQDEQAGTRLYNPKKLDVWGVGVVLFYLLTGQFPFDCPTPFETAEAIARGALSHALPSDVPNDARDMLRRLLEANHEERIDARAALHHPFVRSLLAYNSV